MNQLHPGGSVFVCGSQLAHGSNSSSLSMFGNLNNPVSKPGHSGSGEGSEVGAPPFGPMLPLQQFVFTVSVSTQPGRSGVAVLALLLVPPEVDAVRVARALARAVVGRTQVRRPDAHAVVDIGVVVGRVEALRRVRSRHGSWTAPSAASCRGASCRRCSCPRRCCRCRPRSACRCRPAPGTSGHTTVGSRSSAGCLQYSSRSSLKMFLLFE